MSNISAEEAAKVLSNFVNNMCFDSKEFVDKIIHEHRTLQQQMFGLFLKCIEAWAQQTNFDARNEYTIKTSKKIIESIQDNYVGGVPFI